MRHLNTALHIQPDACRIYFGWDIMDSYHNIIDHYQGYYGSQPWNFQNTAHTKTFQNIASCFEFLKPPEKTQKIYEGKTERPRKVERKWCIGVSKSWKFWDTAEMGGELLHIFINVHICVHVEMYIQIYISIYICVCIDLKLHTKYVCRSSLLMRRGLVAFPPLGLEKLPFWSTWQINFKLHYWAGCQANESKDRNVWKGTLFSTHPIGKWTSAWSSLDY